MDRAIGHKLAKGRGARIFWTGDAVDSWKVIVVEPEKQLTLLFGMKAPGLGRLCLAWKIKATIVLSMSALSDIRTVCRGCFGY